MYHGQTMGAYPMAHQTIVTEPSETALLPKSSTYAYGVDYDNCEARPFLTPSNAGGPIHHAPDQYVCDDEYREYSFDSTVGPLAFCWETICCCCPFLCTKTGLGADDGGFGNMPWGSFRSKQLNVPQNGSSGLTQEVYRKIREVDQEQSTLTNAGPQGLSARILDKFEYRQDQSDGTPEMLMCQTVEIIKKPGQSLGIFLREGNGVDKLDGVYISRLGDNSEFIKYGDILKQGDEILTVNNVDVSHMSIDEVVVIMSIPRRLLLRIRFTAKSRRQLQSILKDDHSVPKYGPRQKPVVVLKQSSAASSSNAVVGLNREESVESGMDEFAGPTPTAHTSLGMKARQQLEELHRNTGNLDPSYGTATQLMQKRLDQPRRSNSDRWNNSSTRPAVSQYSTLPHRPRVLNQPVSFPSNSGSVSRLPAFSQPTSHLLPSLDPLRLSGAQGYLPGGATLPRQYRTLNPALHIVQPGANTSINPQLFSPRSVVSDSITDYHNSFSTPSYHQRIPQPPPAGLFRDQHSLQPADRYDLARSGPPPPLPPKPAIRRSVGYPGLPPHLNPAHKSNSLPRRTPGPMRNIRWRNDLINGASYIGCDVTSDSDGAVSAPEFPLSPSSAPSTHIYANLTPYRECWPLAPPPSVSSTIDDVKTVDEIFSSQEYRQWAGGRRPEHRWTTNGVRQRSSSMPPRGVIDDYANLRHAHMDFDSPMGRDRMHQSYHDGVGYSDRFSVPPSMHSPVVSWIPPSMGVDPSVFTRLDVSPLLNRRKPAPLQTAGPGWNVDDDLTSPEVLNQQSPIPNMANYPSTSQTRPRTRGPRYPQNDHAHHHRAYRELVGLFVIHIAEGRGLKIPDTHKQQWSDELYCVLEVDGDHRARTGVSTWAQRFQWAETFEIDCYKVLQADFYVYSWHPQLRHKLCHRASLKLIETFAEKGDQEQRFALNLEPRGQLLVRVSFLPLNQVFRRPMSLARGAYFGVDLPSLVERECSGLDVPIMVRRLIEEIERRGVDTVAIYLLCGAAEKKSQVRLQMEKSPLSVDLSADAVPDTNVLTAVLKDWLRELPTPLVPGCIYQMLVDAYRVCLPNDRHANARLMLGVVDCMPRINKCTMMVLMDHLKSIASHSPHNGVSLEKLCVMFGPLLCCTAHPRFALPPDIAASAAAAGLAELCTKSTPVNPLDSNTSTQVLHFLLDMWPGRASSSESSGSENSTINMTNNGAISLLDVWLQEHEAPESNL